MITFFLIMVLAVFMLHTGLAILLGYNTLHKEKQEQYNFADLMVHPIQKRFSITKNGADEDSKDMYDTSSNAMNLLPYGEWGEMEAPHFVELSEEEYDNPIYISYYYNANLFKARLGDSIDLKVGDKYYTFQVAGFFESLISSEMGVGYVSPSLYYEWKNSKKR